MGGRALAGIALVSRTGSLDRRAQVALDSQSSVSPSEAHRRVLLLIARSGGSRSVRSARLVSREGRGNEPDDFNDDPETGSRSG